MLTVACQLLIANFMIRCINNKHPVLVPIGKKAKIRNRYNQLPHLTRTLNGKVKKTTTKKHRIPESQKVSPFQTGDYKVATKQASQYGKDKTCTCTSKGGTVFDPNS